MKFLLFPLPTVLDPTNCNVTSHLLLWYVVHCYLLTSTVQLLSLTSEPMFWMSIDCFYYISCAARFQVFFNYMDKVCACCIVCVCSILSETLVVTDLIKLPVSGQLFPYSSWNPVGKTMLQKWGWCLHPASLNLIFILFYLKLSIHLFSWTPRFPGNPPCPLEAFESLRIWGSL